MATEFAVHFVRAVTVPLSLLYERPLCGARQQLLALCMVWVWCVRLKTVEQLPDSHLYQSRLQAMFNYSHLKQQGTTV